MMVAPWATLTDSSLTNDPRHADEEHHTPDVQHTADLQKERFSYTDSNKTPN